MNEFHGIEECIGHADFSTLYQQAIDEAKAERDERKHQDAPK